MSAAVDATTADFLLALARSLHAVGQPAHLLEDTIGRAAARLGVTVQVMALPTAILLSFGDGSVMRLFRGPVGTTNLERFGEVTAVADEVVSGALSPAKARERLDMIGKSSPRWGPLAVIAAYVLSAAAFDVFFEGNAADLLAAIGVGLAVGVVAVCLRRAAGTRLFELTAAAAAGLVAGAVERELGEPTAWVPLAAGLIILLPGLSLVDAIEELANARLVAGSARLAGVIVGFLALGFGVILGVQLAEFLPAAPIGAEAPLPGWAWAPALVAVAVGSMVRFRARPADLGVILGASALAYGGARFGVLVLGPFAGPFLAALLLSLASQGYARWWRRPAEVIEVPGLALLVPGSVGLRGLAAVAAADPAAGFDAGVRMFLITMALVAGLLAGNTLVRSPPPG